MLAFFLFPSTVSFRQLLLSVMTTLFRFSCQQMEAKRISIENTANVVNFHQIIEKCNFLASAYFSQIENGYLGTFKSI